MRGEHYPQMMHTLLPIASLPERVGGRNLLWRRLLIKIIQLGENERRGTSTQQPASLGLAWNLFELMVGSPANLTTAFAGPRRRRQPHPEHRRRGVEGRDGQ